tara:strand:- start:228 stop:494 length:267 start_codon:yes stop_codon:yes gene_type:complete
MRRDYNDKVYADWRRKVYKRDKFTCQMPGCKRKTYLQAHHIQKWADASALRFEVDNGITLCFACHKEVTGAEHQYASLFMEIVRKNNG